MHLELLLQDMISPGHNLLSGDLWTYQVTIYCLVTYESRPSQHKAIMCFSNVLYSKREKRDGLVI